MHRCTSWISPTEKTEGRYGETGETRETGETGETRQTGEMGRPGRPEKSGKWAGYNTGDTGENRKICETVEQIQSFYLILFNEIFIFTNLLIELFEMISKSSPSPLDVFCKLN